MVGAALDREEAFDERDQKELAAVETQNELNTECNRVVEATYVTDEVKQLVDFAIEFVYFITGWNNSI